MQRKWTLAIIALVAAIAAVVFAFMAGKESCYIDEPSDLDPNDPDPDPDKTDGANE